MNRIDSYDKQYDFREYREFGNVSYSNTFFEHMSLDELRQFRDKIDWDELSYFGCNAFNEKFFEEFTNDVNWNFILTKQKDKITEKINERFENERRCKEIK